MINFENQFPIVKRKIHGKKLIYLDSAATSQIAKSVVETMNDFEFNHRANVHRGIHTLSEEASLLYDQAREYIAKFIEATIPAEIVFVRNTTEALNAVAYSWGYKNLGSGDIILVSEAEHHSNFVEWQILAQRKNCTINFIPVDKNGFLDIHNVNTDWSKVKLVAYHLVSNVLGVVNDTREINKIIKRKVGEAKKLDPQQYDIQQNFPAIVLDVSQAIAHRKVNVKRLGADFIAFSGHKMYGPMGIGVLWINRDRFPEIEPYFWGGGMIKEVGYDNTSFTVMPEMMEAGTPNVTGAIGIAQAAKFIDKIGYDHIEEIDNKLMEYAISSLYKTEGVNIIGSIDPSKKCSVIAFNVEGIPSHDLATVLDSEGVAIRSGQHCVMPWHLKTQILTSARLSFGVYNEISDIDELLFGIKKAKELVTN